MTLNLRAWLHFFDLRCAEAAHPQMREIADMIKKEFIEQLPEIFISRTILYIIKLVKRSCIVKDYISDR